MIEPEDMHILIADDMENMCKSIRAMLKILKYGKSFTFANNGRQALKFLRGSVADVDLALLDWNMPVMNGVELLAHIRNDRALRDMPVIMVTAEANIEIVAEAAESEIDAYLIKPLTVQSLGDKIKSVLKKVNDPPPMYYHLKRARNFDEDNLPDKAMDEMRLAIEADANSSKPVREMGVLLFKQNELKKAEQCFLKAASMNRLDVIAFHHLGEIYMRKNDVENAAKYFEKAMNISPRHVERSIHFGRILARNGSHDQAKKVFTKAISISNDPLEIQEEIASYCLKVKMCDYAIKLYRSLLENNRDSSEITINMALAYEQTGETTRAINIMLDAENIDDFDIDIKINLAKMYMRQGKQDRADATLRQAEQLAPDNEEVQKLVKNTFGSV